MRPERLLSLSPGRLALALLLTLTLHGRMVQAQTCSSAGSVTAWQCWEHSLASTGSYALPWRDVKLRIDFTASGQTPFSVYAFWESGSQFKFRTAFPPPTGASTLWSWSTFCVAGCGADTGLSTPTGNVTVTPYTGTNPLYQHGFLKVYVNAADTFNNGRYLVHADGVPFFWLGDTAWNAPVRAQAPPQAPQDEWQSYIADRKQKGFTVVQLALPVDYMDPPSGDQPKDKNGVGDRPFTKLSSVCTPANPIPNSTCWAPTAAFWQRFEQKIEHANEQGLAVVLVGLMERLIESDPAYPTIPDSQLYARYVVARLSGNFTIFSPGFDRKPDVDPATCTDPVCLTSTAISCRIACVGREIDRDTARHLITNHFAGGIDSPAMQPFQSQPWLDFQMVQSGHAGSASGGNEATQLTLITQRARQMPLDVRAFPPSPKPVINGEAVYDGAAAAPCPGLCGPVTVSCPAQASPCTCAQACTTNHNAYRARQTAYLSLLSGAFGYTYGVQGVFDWGTSGILWSSGITRPSSTQMQILAGFFTQPAPNGIGTWYQLVPESGRIQNQATLEEKKMVVARGQNGNFLVAYLPDDPTIKIRFASLPNVPRNGRWFNPRLGTFSATPATGVVDPADSLAFTYTRPACPAGDTACPGEPDWLLILP